MVTFRRIAWFIMLILVVGVWTLRGTGTAQVREPDVRYVPTPEEVVVEMLETARVTRNDIVYDLGCGDGRIVITAAKVFGARGVGVDIDPVRIRESRENARNAGVADRVKFLEKDLFQVDIREATVVTLYLLSDLNLKLRPKLLRDLKPGTRVVSHEFGMDDWKPDNTGIVRNVKIYYNPVSPDEKDTHFYYWIIPAKGAGAWRWTLSTPKVRQNYTLRLIQKFQEVLGGVNARGKEGPIEDARLAGDQLSFTFREDTDKQTAVMRFNGRIRRDTIKGSVEIQGGPFAGKHDWTARRAR